MCHQGQLSTPNEIFHVLICVHEETVQFLGATAGSWHHYR
jgi:hypothetical protein